MFEKILIANRGEIAIRIHRACREMGIKTVAVHSTADANAMHVKLADEAVCIGPGDSEHSYLNKAAIISAALLTGADAIHPGYGFLSENADFADMVAAHGLVFIGPKADMIRQMGDKIRAREVAKEIGLPLLPGSDGAVRSMDEALKWGQEIGYPVIFKPALGGGGLGMQIAWNAEQVAGAFYTAQRVSEKLFDSNDVFVEKYLAAPRHIEVQILADNYGEVVHFGERDCSVQRHHQKVLEESPSPALNAEQRAYLGDLATSAVKKMGYTNIGTLEFLFDQGQFYFLEMNTRLQVEHPVSEMVSGIDLVREQIRLSFGAPLGYTQKDIHLNGCAIECRINAEDPQTFMPCAGKIGCWHVPGGLKVRVDSGMYAGVVVPPYYDSLVAKLIVSGTTRNAVLMRLKRALDEFVIEGIKTTIPLHQKIITNADFIDGSYHIHWLENLLEKKQ